MRLFAAFVFFLYASQECFSVKVEVQEGAESVVLPCQYNQVLEEIVTVKWSRRDLNPSIVHQRREGDDLQSQNQLFRGRTSMRSDTLDSGDFSLTLKDFQLSDIGNYICSMIDDEEEKTLSEVELHLKASQDSLTKKVEVQWVESVVLPCQYDQQLEEIVTVKWSRRDLNPSIVHQRREGDDLQSQNQLFKGRTSMRADAFDSSDFSLTLSELQLSDSGNYICSIIDDEEIEIMLSGVQLHVKEIPTWFIVLLVLLILLVFAVAGGLLYHFRDKFESVSPRAKILLGVLVVLVILAVSAGLLYRFQHKFSASQDSLAVTVEVQEGEPSVVLPCQISKRLEEIVTVKWSRFDLNPNIVHQRREGDDLHAQNQVFRGRTSMIPEALDSGDFSLTLTKPQLLDSGVYICSMSENQEETALSGVQLHVKASQESLNVSLDVYQGDSSVVLPCQNSQSSEGILTVKWSRFDLNPNTVHQRREGDDLQAQNVLFSGRTSMRSDAVDVGDFSLTLREPQLLDSGVYICSIHQESEEKMLSGIQLNVKEIFPTWATIFLVLLVLLLISGGLLFHFRHYFISVYRVKVDSGEEFVLLPFKTAARLPEKVIVNWRHNNGKTVNWCYRKVFMCSVYFGSLSVQHDQYKDRTEIVKKGKFGDFSLILKNPTDRDTGTYSCTVYDYRSQKVLTRKQVLLDVKAGPDSLIIAIDFGSGFSGYAFNVKPREEGGETQIKRWSNGLGLDTPKTPTCILFDEQEEFMKFGYEAKTAFNNMRGEETKKHYFLEDFKWDVLYIDYSWERIYTADMKRMSTQKVFTEALRFLKDDALKTIRSHPERGRFTADDFTWVMTVPDILKDFPKRFIIESATLAGLVTDDTKDKLMFVLESEAALTWCLKLQPDGFIKQNHSRDSQDQPAEPDTSCNDPAGSQEAVKFTVEPEETKVLLETQRDGKRFLVVDCGDENINFTVHDVLEGGAMKKLCNESKYNLGGRSVDGNFKQFLRKIFSDEVWDKYEKNFPLEVLKMMFDFTRLKHLDEDVQIRCPDNLVMLAQKKKEIETFFDSEEGASWNNGSIRINREKLKTYYDESLQGITESLGEILNKNLNIGYIVLVGGLAESQILRQLITDQFGPQYKVLCPLRPQEVILKGAVEMGRNLKLLESQRKCPASFKCLS